MMTFGLILVFISLVLIDFKKVWKNKGKVDKIVYTAILSFAFAISELHILGVKLIGLNQILDKIMKIVGLH